VATPDYYVDSNATGTDSGASWANAFPTVDDANSAGSGGEIVWVASDHSESAATILGTANGSARDNPIIYISVNSGTDAYEKGASVGNSGSVNLGTFSDTGFVFIGMDVTATGDITVLSDTSYRFIDCTINEDDTTAASEMFLNGDVFGLFPFIGVDFTCDVSGGEALVLSDKADILGGSFTGANIGDVFGFLASKSNRIIGLDMSGAATTADAFSGANNLVSLGAKQLLSGCKSPTSFDFPGYTPAAQADKIVAVNSISNDAGHEYREYQRAGIILDDTSVYLNSAIDGSDFSLELSSNANCNFGIPLCLELPEFDAAANATVTFNLITETTLNTNDCFIELLHPDATDTQLLIRKTSFDSSEYAGTAESALTTNTESWTDDLTSPNKYEISITVSGGAAGMHKPVLFLTKASVVVYVDPTPEIT
jgi:hypothetical protein